MTIQLKNQTELLNTSSLLRKVKMVTSNRDGRIGFIVKATEDKVFLKLEGISNLLEFSFEQFIHGFSFSFTKTELVEAVYRIKNLRKQCPRLITKNDVYLSSNFVFDYLEQYFDDVSNHDVYVILEKLKTKFENS
jgi:hypothetical protein